MGSAVDGHQCRSSQVAKEGCGQKHQLAGNGVCLFLREAIGPQDPMQSAEQLLDTGRVWRHLCLLLMQLDHNAQNLLLFSGGRCLLFLHPKSQHSEHGGEGVEAALDCVFIFQADEIVHVMPDSAEKGTLS